MPDLITRKLRYEMGDFDAADTYLFTLDASDGLAVHFQMGTSDQGDLAFSKAALESAAAFVVISQGGAMGSALDALPAVIDRDLPPFLLSRSVFAALKADGTASLKAEWATADAAPVELELAGTEQLPLKVDGATVTVDVLHCTGGDVELWVVDDATWPIIVKREECGGDNFWALVEAGTDLEPGDGDE